MTAQLKAEPVRQARSRAFAGMNGLMSFGLVVVGALTWQMVTVLVDEKFFPTPLSIGKRVATLLFGGAPERLFLAPAFYEQLLPSVGRILLGFFLGSFVGLLIGLVIGANRVLGDYVNPIVDYMRAIPATASLPIFILLLGGEDTMRVAFIAWGLSWYVLVNTAVGVANLDRTMLDMAKSFRISRLRLPVQVMIPAALPKTFAGLRVSLTAAVLLSVVSEFFLATNGIGFQMIQAQRRINVLDMWSWMVILALLGYVLNTALDLTESRVLKWHRQSHR